MADNTEQLVLQVIADVTNALNGMSQVQSAMQETAGAGAAAGEEAGGGFMNSLTAAMSIGMAKRVIGNVMGAIQTGIKDSIENFNIQNTFDNVFTGLGGSAEKALAGVSSKTGYYSQIIRDQMGQIGQMLKVKGLSGDSLVSHTAALTQDVDTIALAKHKDPNEVYNALYGALAGYNTRSAEQYGINLTKTQTGDFYAHDKSLQKEMGGKKFKDLSGDQVMEVRQASLENQMSKGNMDAQAASANRFAQSTANLKSAWSELISKMMSPVLQALTPIIKVLGDGVAWWVTQLKAGNPWIKAITVALGILVAIVGTAITIFAVIVVIWGTLTIVAAALGVGIGGIAGAMWALMLPILIVVAAIAALIAVIYLCIKYWANIKEAAAVAWNWIVNVWKAAPAFFQGIGNAILGAFNTAVKAVEGVFTGLWDKVKAIGGWIAGVWNGLTGKSATVTVSSGGTVKKNAAGGIFTGFSQLGSNIFGEAGHEAVIPLSAQGLKPFAEALAGQGMGGGGVTVQNMYVRNDQDIRSVAQELFKLQQAEARKKGAGYGY